MTIHVDVKVTGIVYDSMMTYFSSGHCLIKLILLINVY